MVPGDGEKRKRGERGGRRVKEQKCMDEQKLVASASSGGGSGGGAGQGSGGTASGGLVSAARMSLLA